MTEMVITSLFDPEIIIPSEESVMQLEFWARLQEWTRDPRPLMSLETSKKFNALLLSPPDITGLPRGDFWTIASRLAARVHNETITNSSHCEEHIRAVYAPLWGKVDNIELLIDALTHSPAGRVTVLATDERCWPESIGSSECEMCKTQKITLQPAPEDDLAVAFRDQFLSFVQASPSLAQEHAAQLFPKLRFSESAWSHLDTLGGDPRVITANLVAHLGVLNDFAVEIWEAQTTTADRQAQLGALGITASPESPSIRRSRTAMNVRTFAFDGESIKCEWHTKLQPARDRIYFAVHDRHAYTSAQSLSTCNSRPDGIARP